MKIMFGAAFVLLVSLQTGWAKDIGNCGSLFFWVADDCLNKSDLKIKSNSQAEIARLKKRLAELERKIAAIVPPDLSKYAQKTDLNSYVKFDSNIRLRNGNWTSQCIDNATQNADFIHGWPCNDHPAQSWKVEAR